jgi:topoisomerase-4 subunit A
MAKNTTLDPPDNGGEIIEEAMSDALSKRYLAYALSTITARALPDVRDGLKPVHRRVLYSMSQLGLNPNGRRRGHR